MGRKLPARSDVHSFEVTLSDEKLAKEFVQKVGRETIKTKRQLDIPDAVERMADDVFAQLYKHDAQAIVTAVHYGASGVMKMSLVDKPHFSKEDIIEYMTARVEMLLPTIRKVIIGQ